MDLLTSDIKKVYRKYMFSAFGSAIITSIYSMVDIICVGQYEGKVGAAALACIAPMWSIFISMGMLFGIGGAVRMSFCRGEGRKAEGDRYFTAALVSALVLSAMVCVGTLLFGEEILRLFGADDTLLPCAMAYTRWVFPVMPCFMVAQVLSAFIRNDGAPLLCTGAILTGGILNMILDVLLVFGFDMGSSGAGLATAIGQVVATLILCAYFLQKRCGLRLMRVRGFFRLALESLQAGFAPFVVDISYGIAVALFNNQIMRYGSDVELAVYGTVSSIALIFQCLFYGVGQALQPIASVNYGAGKQERVRQVFRLAMGSAAIMGALFFLVSELIPGPMLRLYMDVDDSVMAVGPSIIRAYAASFLVMGINIVASYYLQSVLQSGKSVLLSLCRGFGFCALFLYALPAVFDLGGIWWTMPLTELCTFVLALGVMKPRKQGLL